VTGSDLSQHFQVLQDISSTVVVRDFTEWKEDKEDVWRFDSFIRREGLGVPRNDDHEQLRERCSPHVLVIDDLGMGFGDDVAELEQLPLKGDTTPLRHVIVKLEHPKFIDDHGVQKRYESVLSQLIKTLSNQDDGPEITIYCKAENLRSAGVFIGAALSWDLTFQMLATALYKEREALLPAHGRLIVAFGLAGALVAEKQSENVVRYTLIFDPFHQEDDWEEKNGIKRIGLGRYVLAGCALETAHALAFNHPPRWIGAVVQSLQVARKILHEGFGTRRVRRGFAQRKEVSSLWVTPDSDRVAWGAMCGTYKDSSLYPENSTDWISWQTVTLGRDTEESPTLWAKRSDWTLVERMAILASVQMIS
jgi:hypothetical protein